MGGGELCRGDSAKVKIATRAAIDHEGHVLGGRILEKGIKEDNYIAELAAQLDALTDAVNRGSEERIIIIFDATSPVRAMLRFGRLGARARGDPLRAVMSGSPVHSNWKCHHDGEHSALANHLPPEHSTSPAIISAPPKSSSSCDETKSTSPILLSSRRILSIFASPWAVVPRRLATADA